MTIVRLSLISFCKFPNVVTWFPTDAPVSPSTTILLPHSKNPILIMGVKPESVASSILKLKELVGTYLSNFNGPSPSFRTKYCQSCSGVLLVVDVVVARPVVSFLKPPKLVLGVIPESTSFLVFIFKPQSKSFNENKRLIDYH